MPLSERVGALDNETRAKMFPPTNPRVSKVLALPLYVVITCAMVVCSLEVLLRLVFSEPDMYWPYRFLFVSPNVYQNRDNQFWTYRPHMMIREAAVYAIPRPLQAQPKVIVEYDCYMKSNNLGLLQNDDIEPGSTVTMVIGDSFTAGQGGCPWFHRLQVRRETDHLLNGGAMGTGFGHWRRLVEYLQIGR